MSEKLGWSLRQYVWSVKRELWGNRFLIFGPLVFVCLPLFLFCLQIYGSHLKVLNGTEEEIPPNFLLRIIAELIFGVANVSALVVGCIYSLGTFYNERKDLTVLFWKSLPVSDRLSVVAKASVVLLIGPVLSLFLSVGAMIILGPIIAQAYGISVMDLARQASWGHLTGDGVVYIVLNTLWWFPVYALLFVVSASVRTVPVVWVFGSFAGLYIVEVIGLRRNHITSLVWDRFFNFPGTGFRDAQMKIVATQMDGFNVEHTPTDKLISGHLDFSALFASPALWWGVVLGVGCLALTVWLRRRGEPI
ncbi:ABC transporter permease [Gluconobacter frateurii]|uniref:ABC transporter permease n=1 Tax=Gluconobacter frateurii NRIC 0228 TaxID=1307946 RepID=A0ABQ0Q7R3_9PROT|nr:ABC transporter permease [Gluconobacter frateurii]GBR08169.1 putative ABC transporter permease [Gluconobacter frateurii NRIC 0228]GLP91174.1 hypothetical protein GCM10007868_22490 [Gluconobacter frateurii]